MQCPLSHLLWQGLTACHGSPFHCRKAQTGRKLFLLLRQNLSLCNIAWSWICPETAKTHLLSLPRTALQLTHTPPPASTPLASCRFFPTQFSVFASSWPRTGTHALHLPQTSCSYLAPRVQWGQDDVVGVGGGSGTGQCRQGMLAPMLGHLGVAFPAAKQQPI